MECIIPLIITILIIYHYYIIYTEGYIYIFIFIAKPKKRWFMMVSYFLAVTWGYEDLEEIFATFRCRLGL